MSKRFIISEEEKKRILILHDYAIKKQFLTNEQYVPDPKIELRNCVDQILYDLGKSRELLRGINSENDNEISKYIISLIDGNKLNDYEKDNIKYRKACLDIIRNSSSVVQTAPDQSNTPVKNCIDETLKKMGYTRETFAQTYNSNPNDDKQLTQNLITTYNDRPNQRVHFSQECKSYFGIKVVASPDNNQKNKYQTEYQKNKSDYIKKLQELLNSYNPQLKLTSGVLDQQTLQAAKDLLTKSGVSNKSNSVDTTNTNNQLPEFQGLAQNKK